jgi:capsular exopolysaccharide synthesis family protein
MEGEEHTSIEPEKIPPNADRVGNSAGVEHVPNGVVTDVLARFQTLQASVAEQYRLIAFTESESPAAEAFRLLGVRLRDLGRKRPLKKMLITSTIPQEGKSMVAANLACTLALSSPQKVLLIEGDLRHPSLSQVFGVPGMKGLSEWLQEERGPMTGVYYIEGPGIWLLPAGSASQNALELLQSARLPALMDHLAALFDWIIIDSPPVLPLADASVWTRLADGILLVTREGTTEKRQLQKGIEALDGKKLIGALLNSSSNNGHDYSYYRRPTPAAQ